MTEVDPAGMARIRDNRTASNLDARAPKRFTRVDRLPGGRAIITRKKATPADPDEECALPILRKAMYAGPAQACARWRKCLPTVERTNHLAELRPGIDNLRIMTIDSECAVLARPIQVMERLPAIGRLEEAVAAVERAGIDDVGVGGVYWVTARFADAGGTPEVIRRSIA